MFSIVTLGGDLGCVSPEGVPLRHEEGRSLDPVHHHEVLTRLRHWLIAGTLLLQELVESLHLLVLLHHIVDIVDLELADLSHLLFVLLAKLLLFIFF